MTKHVTIEAVKIKETDPMPHNTYKVKLNGSVYQTFNELSNDSALANANALINKLIKNYERNSTIEVARGF